MKALVGGRLIDGTGREPVAPSRVLIQDGLIQEAGPEDAIDLPPGCEVIDVTGKTVLPGLMDLHVHLCLGEDDVVVPRGGLPPNLEQPLTYIGIKGFAYARRALEMGFTTLRDAGDVGYVSVALREAVNVGLVEGPRLIASGHWLTTTSGHADFLPLWLSRRDDVPDVPDGVDEVLKAVRRQIKMRTDWIKLFVTGGVMDPEDKQEFNDQELKVAIDEAHAKEKPVMGHCMHARGTLAGVKAGLDTVEHGSDLTEEIVELMVQKGTSLVPTLAVAQAVVDQGEEFGLPPVYVERFRPFLARGLKSLDLALQAGVNIALGTDAGFNMLKHGDNGVELEALFSIGLSPMQVIQSATRNAAAALKMEDRLGTLEKGKLADVVVVAGDPLKDLTIFQDKNEIALVIKEGRIMVNRLSGPASLF